MVYSCLVSLAGLSVALAGWVFWDARQRKANVWQWTLGTIVISPIMLPMYRARRPLQVGEIRRGGPDWIVARNFAWVWSLFMLIIVGWTTIVLVTGSGLPSNDEVSQTNTTISRALALLMMTTCCWLFPVVAALFLSIALYYPDDVEGNHLISGVEVDNNPD